MIHERKQMQRIKVNLFYYTDLIIPVLYTSCLLGLLHEWLDILNLQIWILWFLLHIACLAIFIIYEDLNWLRMSSEDRKHLMYINLLSVLWYYQKVYTILYYPTGSYVSSCNRDLLILHFSFALTVVVVVVGAAIAGCFRG